jgi:hypothetical protein
MLLNYSADPVISQAGSNIYVQIRNLIFFVLKNVYCFRSVAEKAFIFLHRKIKSMKYSYC